jgi:hypothetical protein
VFDQASGFLSKTQIWDDHCNCPNDVDSRPDASQHALDARASDMEIFVHQINRPDDLSPDLDSRSLYMEIACSGSAIVRTTGHHSPDEA